MRVWRYSSRISCSWSSRPVSSPPRRRGQSAFRPVVVDVERRRVRGDHLRLLLQPDRHHAQFPAHAVLPPARVESDVLDCELGEPVPAAGPLQVPPPDASSIRQRSSAERDHAGSLVNVPVRPQRPSGGIRPVLRAQPVSRRWHRARLPGSDAARPAGAVRHGAGGHRDRGGDLDRD